MPRQTGAVLPWVIGAFVTFTLTVLGNPTSAVANCIAAPKSPAPEGSYWYYRTDRATKRKCWYLGPLNRKVEKAVLRAALQSEASDTPRTAASDADDQRSPLRTQFELLVRLPWSATHPGYHIPEAAPGLMWLDLPADTTARAEAQTGGPQNVTEDIEASARSEMAPLHPTGNVARFLPVGQMLPLTAGGLAFATVVVIVVSIVAAARRRRVNAGRRIAKLASKSPAPVRPTVVFAQPLPPMELIPRPDDVEEALRQFSRARKRRAA